MAAADFSNLAEKDSMEAVVAADSPNRAEADSKDAEQAVVAAGDAEQARDSAMNPSVYHPNLR